jgi:hypothetical protein
MNMCRFARVLIGFGAILALGCGADRLHMDSHGTGRQWYNEGVEQSVATQSVICNKSTIAVIAWKGCTLQQSPPKFGSGTMMQQLARTNERKLTWNFKTENGKTGILTFDRESFDTAKGALLLVDASGKELKCSQRTIDVSSIKKPSLDQLLEAAPDDKIIVDFVNSIRAADPDYKDGK